jgi:hypothetical protein
MNPVRRLEEIKAHRGVFTVRLYLSSQPPPKTIRAQATRRALSDLVRHHAAPSLDPLSQADMRQKPIKRGSAQAEPLFIGFVRRTYIM